MKKKILCLLLAVMLLVALAGCQSKREKIVIAGKTYTEAQLTSEIIAQMIEQGTDLEVERKYDMASAICFESIRKGDVDLYPDYTGSMVMAYLKQEIEPGTSPEETYRIAKEGFEEEYNLIVLESMGFNNTYANAIQRELAEAHGITTSSQLAPFTPELRFGAEHAFYDRLDGYDNMCAAYGFQFNEAFKIDVGLKQQSLTQGEIDVACVYTTDGWLQETDLVVLEDDRNFFPAYNVCPVVRKDVLDKYPEIAEVLKTLKDCCTEEDMIHYNYLVDSGKMTIPDAASEFIKEKNLLG